MRVQEQENILQTEAIAAAAAHGMEIISRAGKSFTFGAHPSKYHSDHSLCVRRANETQQKETCWLFIIIYRYIYMTTCTMHLYLHCTFVRYVSEHTNNQYICKQFEFQFDQKKYASRDTGAVDKPDHSPGCWILQKKNRWRKHRKYAFHPVGMNCNEFLFASVNYARLNVF